MSFLSQERLATLCLAVFLLLAGCAEKGPIFLDIAYQPPAEKTLGSPAITIGVSPIKDVRGLAPSVLGKRTVASGLENDLVTRGTVADLVTARLKDAVKAHGMAVKDVAPWDMTPEGMPAGGYDLLLGGEIESLWLDSVSVPFKTSLKTSVRLKIVVGEAAEKKVIRIIKVNSKIDEDVLYSLEELNEMLSESLSSALEQIFQDDVLRKKIH
jgi:predicted small lipoprotein YifL